MRSWRIASLLAPALAVWGSLAAQQTRNDRIAQAFAAYDNFQPDQALDLLRRSLSPIEGPQDSIWFRGVELLAQILTEQNQASEAQVWLRWALRLNPAAPIDTINFVPEVVSAARGALTAVRGGSPGDSVTRTTWEWTAPGAGQGRGMLRIESPGMAQPVRALVQGQIVESGRTLTLPAGTYEIQAAAEGYLTALVRREVLSGVTTVLSFNLTPVSVAAPAPPAPALPPPVAPPPQITPPVVVPAVLSEAARVAVQRQLAPLSATRFGTAATCGTAAFVGRSGLLLTTYQSIRGADRLEVELAGGRRLAEEVRVAAYDVQADLAVLQIPAIRAESLSVASSAEAGQLVFGFGFSDCRTPQEARLSLAGATPAALQLADSAPASIGPLVNASGALVGYRTAPRAAAGPAAVVRVLDEARRNLAASQVLSPGQVALKENHAYGSVALSSDLAGARVRITPLEPWQWAETATGGALPLTFTGPMGRYHLQLEVAGQVRREMDFTVRPAVADRLAITVQAIAQQPQPAAPAPQVKKKGGGGAAVVLAILGIGGAGAAVAVLASKKQSSGGSGGTKPPPSTGAIVINVPNPSVIGTLVGMITGR
jgi:hypothetical protein